jgi:hypothetical protein
MAMEGRADQEGGYCRQARTKVIKGRKECEEREGGEEREEGRLGRKGGYNTGVKGRKEGGL